MSKLTQGTHVFFLDTTGQTPEVVKVACATSFNPGGDPAGEHDDTCLDSNEMEYIAGMRNPGTASLGLRPDPERDSHLTMWNLSRMNPSPKLAWAVGWSDGDVKPRFGQGVGAVTISAGGSGYENATVEFSDPEDADGVTATGVATVVNGEVTDIIITDPGSGYAAAPTVSITDSASGTGATATATLGDYGFVLPGSRTWFTMSGYISDFPFDFQTNALVEAEVSIRRTGGAQWHKKAA